MRRINIRRTGKIAIKHGGEPSVSLQLHIDSNGYWLIDPALGGVQVGEAFQEKDGSWSISFEGGDVVGGAPLVRRGSTWLAFVGP
jgi:hypothetical protein